MSGSRVPLGYCKFTPYPEPQGGGMIGKKWKHHNLIPRDSGNATLPTANPLTVRVSHKQFFHTYNLLVFRTIHTNQIHISIYWQCYSPIRSFLLILPVRYFNRIPGHMVKYHKICKYLRCSPKSIPSYYKSQSFLTPRLPLYHSPFISVGCYHQSLSLPTPIFNTLVVDPPSLFNH